MWSSPYLVNWHQAPVPFQILRPLHLTGGQLVEMTGGQIDVNNRNGHRGEWVQDKSRQWEHEVKSPHVPSSILKY
jgi:hypothetical protein